MFNKAASIFLFCGMIFVLLVVGGCANAPAGGDSEDTYIIGDEQGDWGYPSPFTAYPRGPGYLRMSYIFDTLVWKDSEGFTEALAEDWTFNEDNNSYIFKLRDGVQWHDGTPFSAQDVVFTFEYLREHRLPWFDLEMIKEIKKLDDKEVKIYLDEPYAAFLNNVVGIMPILPEHIWEPVEEPEEFVEPEAVVGTGPYKLEDYSREQGQYRFTAFSDYYLGEPSVKQLLMVKVSEPHLALQRGDVNYVPVEAESVSNLEDDYNVIEGIHDWNLKLMFNHREEPFAQVEVRRALAKALDLEELVERALRGHGLAGSPGMISPDSRWFAGIEALPDYTYDVQTARDKLKKVDHIFEEELELLTLADYSREAEVVAEQLRELGIEVETRAAERSVVDSRIREWNYDLAITGHGGVGGDPEGVKNFMIGKGSPHLNARYDHPELEEAFREQALAKEEEERKQLVDELQQIYAEELPAFTLHYPTNYYAYDEKVDWFFTHDGIAMGIPMPLNKMALVE